MIQNSQTCLQIGGKGRKRNVGRPGSGNGGEKRKEDNGKEKVKKMIIAPPEEEVDRDKQDTERKQNKLHQGLYSFKWNKGEA